MNIEKCVTVTTAMMAILLIICIGYVVVASLLIHGARKVGSRSICAKLFLYICLL